MKSFSYSALFLSTTAILTGCGGGGGDSASTTTPITPAPTIKLTTLSGVVADGYIQGAIVCVDKNTNLLCDTGELQTTTNNKGEYTLKDVNSDDATNFPVIALVPMGAIDQDDPTHAISQPYTLTTPIGKHAFISPITSIIKEYQEYNGLNTEEASQLIGALVGANRNDLFTNYVTNGNNRELKRLKNLAKLATASFQSTVDRIVNLNRLYTAKQRQNIAIRGFLFQVPFLVGEVSADGYSPALPAPILVSDTANQDLLKLSALPQTTVSPANVLENSPIVAIKTELQPSDCSGIPLTCTGTAYPSFFHYGNTTFNNLQNGSYIAHENSNILNLKTGITEKTTPTTTLVLGTNGWVQLPTTEDDKVSVNGNVVTHNSLSTPRSYMESITTGSIENISIKPYLALIATPLTNSILNSLYALPVKDAFFPKGAINYIYTTTLNNDDYSLSDSSNTDTIFTAPIVSDAYHPEKKLSTLNEAETYFGSNWFKIPSSLTNLQVLLSTNGELKIQKIVISLSQAPLVIDITDKGTWQQKIVNGQALTVLHIPPYLNNRHGTDIFWTVHNSQVVQGVFAPKGRSTQNIAFNKTAFDALKAAIVLTPLP